MYLYILLSRISYQRQHIVEIFKCCKAAAHIAQFSRTGSALEIPCGMLACLLHTDIFALIGTKQPYMLVHYFKLFVGGGGRQCFACFKIVLYFRKYPRPAAGGSADHNQITTGVIVHTFTAFAAVNIAVSYHCYAECLLYLCDYLKVSLTAVHLIFCPAVNGDRLCSAFLSNTGNLSGLFDNVNAKVGKIASDVGSTPQAWNSGIFNMLRSLSETVVLPIAAAILALVMCHELIQMITEKNNMHDFDTSMFFRWIFKSAFAILIVSNTWNIVMGVFDATQSVVNQSSGVIIGETSIHFDRLIPGLEFQLESMTIGSLLSLWFQTLVVGLTMNILSICIFLVTYGRMIEIYVVTALGPIPLATMGSSEWRSTGQNYLKSLLALGFQAFLIMIVVGIYAVLIRNISGAADIAGAIWGCMGYTVLLCFCLFKTGSISKSVFGVH